MGYRHRDTGPRLALWMLVALGDVVLLLVSAGLAAPVAVLAVVALVVAGVAAWRLGRRTTPTGRQAVPVPAGPRRRA